MTKKSEPVRTCIGCRQRRPAQVLLRVRWCNGELIVDRDGPSLGGRGAWLCVDTLSACLARAANSRAFDRAFRTGVAASATADLAARLGRSDDDDRNRDGPSANGGRPANRR